MIRRYPDRAARDIHYTAQRDELAVDGLILPGATIDQLRNADNGAVFRVEHTLDRCTRLHRIEPGRAPEVSDHCRRLANQIDCEGGDRIAGRCLVEAADQIDLLRQAVANLAHQAAATKDLGDIDDDTPRVITHG